MRRYCLAVLVFVQAGCVRTEPVPIARAADYLWKQQAGDGGWHSQRYGLLRSGQALTPFVLGTLLQVPGDAFPLPAAGVKRAISFIRSHTQANGAVGLADPDIPDYPNYSTALAVSALSRNRQAGPDLDRMVAWLRGQQFTEQNGWHPEDPVYGGWGMGGPRRTPPDTGHVDLSMTRYVLEALRAAGASPSDSAFVSARVFVERCQNLDLQHLDAADGGFFFSTTEFDTNKAGHDGKKFRSYGTTTADGILSLLACGATRSDTRVVAAQRWLVSQHRDMNVPGFTGAAYQRWPRGLAFYYASASTQAFRALQVAPGFGVVQELLRTQRRDGSWANPENLVKEDDPLIATAFAIQALASSTKTPAQD